MTDPIVFGHIVTGLVGLFSAYTNYRASLANAKKEGKPEPEKTDDIAKGENVASVIETTIQQHGQEDEKTALVGYHQNPKLFEAPLIQVLSDIAMRSPNFAAQLAALAQQEGISQGGGQTAIGSNIAQADRGSSASVTITPLNKDA